MNIYKVIVTRGNNAFTELNVSAKDMAEAVANANRYAKANYYSNSEVTSAIKTIKVDVHYLTAAKKRK